MRADPSRQDPARRAAFNGTVVTLRLGGELLAIPSNILREILELGTVTRVPNAPQFATGIINVRGAVVPLADLRIPLRMQQRTADEDTRVLVLELALNGVQSVVGILAEKVHEVTTIAESALDEVPSVGTTWPLRFVRAIGRRDDHFFILPDLDAIFATHLAADAGALALSQGTPA